MKKMITVLISAVMLMCCLAGCGAKRDPKYIGKWEADYMSIDGTKYEDIFGLPLSALMRFEMTEDGKVFWKSAIDNKVIQNANEDKDMTWKETDTDRIEIKVVDTTGKTDTQTMELSYAENSLVVSDNGTEIRLKKVDEFTEIDTDMLNSAASAIQNFGITQ